MYIYICVCPWHASRVCVCVCGGGGGGLCVKRVSLSLCLVHLTGFSHLIHLHAQQLYVLPILDFELQQLRRTASVFVLLYQ
jgi:hypothetical protein